MVVKKELSHIVDIDIREVWEREDHDFTPWLADNIDILSAEIGIDLEVSGTEVNIDGKYADIVAIDSNDGSPVIIENQFTITDNSHLGQILSYMSGLQANTSIWIAPSFSDAHLSAIQWLNKITDSTYNFFAIKLRVIRIGDGPCAPIFEVLEKPSEWDKRLSDEKKKVQSSYMPPSERLKRANETVKSIFEKIVSEVDSWGGVEQVERKHYIALKTRRNFAEIRIRNKKLVIHVLHDIEYDDPAAMLSSVPEQYGWPLSNRFEISKEDELEQAISIIRQSYDNTLT